MKHIVVACTKDYYDKAEILFKSLDHNAKDFNKQILCIDFSTKRKGYQTASVKLKALKSYRPGFPSNREFYACAEGGEFLNHFDYKDDDVIIHIDADMIMQRPFYEGELEMLDKLQDNVIYGSLASIPMTTLREEYWRLRPKKGYLNTKAYFQGNWNVPIICAGVIVAKAYTYKNLIYKHYLDNIDGMIQYFDHHAAGQWLMNWIGSNIGQVGYLSNSFHCGEWFLDIKTTTKDNKLYFNEQLVLLIILNF